VEDEFPLEEVLDRLPYDFEVKILYAEKKRDSVRDGRSGRKDLPSSQGQIRGDGYPRW